MAFKKKKNHSLSDETVLKESLPHNISRRILQQTRSAATNAICCMEEPKLLQ